MMMVEEKMEESFWTFAAVEERLIEAMRLWKRSPGGGKWPFASDAPWQWITRKARIVEGGFKGRELQLRMQQEDAEEAKAMEGRDRRGALTREEVALRDETSEWLTWIAPDARKVVAAAIAQRADGRDSIDWARVKRELAGDPLAAIGNKGVYRRYTRAIQAIARRLNGIGECSRRRGVDNSGARLRTALAPRNAVRAHARSVPACAGCGDPLA